MLDQTTAPFRPGDTAWVLDEEVEIVSIGDLTARVKWPGGGHAEVPAYFLQPRVRPPNEPPAARPSLYRRATEWAFGRGMTIAMLISFATLGVVGYLRYRKLIP